jgi:high affinity Mn2+ porin
MISKAPVEALPAPLFNWTGFYFGSHFGYAAGHSLWNGTERGMTIPALAGSLDFFRAFDGFKGTGSYYLGFQGGFSYMFPSRLLIGIEAAHHFRATFTAYRRFRRR